MPCHTGHSRSHRGFHYPVHGGERGGVAFSCALGPRATSSFVGVVPKAVASIPIHGVKSAGKAVNIPAYEFYRLPVSQITYPWHPEDRLGRPTGPGLGLSPLATPSART